MRNVFEEEYNRDIRGRPNETDKLINFCQQYISEEKDVLQRIEKQIDLSIKYHKLSSKEQKSEIGEKIADEFKAIADRDINQVSLDLMNSAHTLVVYTIDAMEEWCHDKIPGKY